jgi:hypothetical protein
MYLVKEAFIDKETKKMYGIDSIYNTEKKKRAEELIKGGFLGPELVIKEEKKKGDK